MNRIYQLVAALFNGAEGALPRAMSAVLTLSVSASVVIVCVLLARLLLRRAPKIFSYALWAVVLFRLLCPVTIESPIAIVPNIGRTAAALTQTGTLQAVDDRTDADTHTDRQTVTVIAPVAQPAYHPAQDGVQPDNYDSIDPDAVQTQKPAVSLAEILSVLWLSVGAGIALFSIVSLLRLRLSLREALRINHNIYICDHISTPFVMGIVRPRIYLPSGLGTLERSYIILHEQHHIKRLDHVVKPVAFAALCIHWFNPLVWLAFALAMRDMEMSCDEAVLRVMDRDIRTDYSMSLLALASGKRMFAPTPLAFGESDTKIRIKNIVRYKKPAAVVIICAALAVIAACGVLGGSRTVDEGEDNANTVMNDTAASSPTEGADSVMADGAVKPDSSDAGLPDAAPPHQAVLSKEEQEAAYRAQIISQTPGLALTEGAKLPYSTDEAVAFLPKDIHNITEAYLLCDYGLLTLTDAAALEALSQNYATAEKLPDEPACGFNTPMFLKRADGAVGYVYPAFDDCGTFKAGDSYYQSTDTMFDFYGLFAMGSESAAELDDEGRTVEVHSFHRLSPTSSEYYIYDGQLLLEYSFVSDFRSHTSVYSHDEAGQLIKSVGTTQYETGETEKEEYIYAYDARGNCISITISRQGDAENSVYSYKYDDSDRLVERQLTVRGTVWPGEVYEYDAAGNCVKVITINLDSGEPESWWQYSYDAQGRLESWDHYHGNGRLSDRYYYKQFYNPDGSTYQQLLDLDGNVIENMNFDPTLPPEGPFFYQ